MLGKILATEDVAGVSPLILWAVQGERRGAGAQFCQSNGGKSKDRTQGCQLTSAGAGKLQGVTAPATGEDHHTTD